MDLKKISKSYRCFLPVTHNSGGNSSIVQKARECSNTRTYASQETSTTNIEWKHSNYVGTIQERGQLEKRSTTTQTDDIPRLRSNRNYAHVYRLFDNTESFPFVNPHSTLTSPDTSDRLIVILGKDGAKSNEITSALTQSIGGKKLWETSPTCLVFKGKNHVKPTSVIYHNADNKLEYTTIGEGDKITKEDAQMTSDYRKDSTTVEREPYEESTSPATMSEGDSDFGKQCVAKMAYQWREPFQDKCRVQQGRISCKCSNKTGQSGGAYCARIQTKSCERLVSSERRDKNCSCQSSAKGEPSRESCFNSLCSRSGCHSSCSRHLKPKRKYSSESNSSSSEYSPKKRENTSDRTNKRKDRCSSTSCSSESSDTKGSRDRKEGKTPSASDSRSRTSHSRKKQRDKSNRKYNSSCPKKPCGNEDVSSSRDSKENRRLEEGRNVDSNGKKHSGKPETSRAGGKSKSGRESVSSIKFICDNCSKVIGDTNRKRGRGDERESQEERKRKKQKGTEKSTKPEEGKCKKAMKRFRNCFRRRSKDSEHENVEGKSNSEEDKSHKDPKTRKRSSKDLTERKHDKNYDQTSHRQREKNTKRENKDNIPRDSSEGDNERKRNRERHNEVKETKKKKNSNHKLHSSHNEEETRSAKRRPDSSQEAKRRKKKSIDNSEGETDINNRTGSSGKRERRVAGSGKKKKTSEKREKNDSSDRAQNKKSSEKKESDTDENNDSSEKENRTGRKKVSSDGDVNKRRPKTCMKATCENKSRYARCQDRTGQVASSRCMSQSFCPRPIQNCFEVAPYPSFQPQYTPNSFMYPYDSHIPPISPYPYLEGPDAHIPNYLTFPSPLSPPFPFVDPGMLGQHSIQQPGMLGQHTMDSNVNFTSRNTPATDRPKCKNIHILPNVSEWYPPNSRRNTERYHDVPNYQVLW